MNAIFVVLALNQTLELGSGFVSFLSLLIILLPFFIAQLLEYNIGIVRTHVGDIGVTEGQLMQILLLLAIAILGPEPLRI